jgi:hypothetical protein
VAAIAAAAVPYVAAAAGAYGAAVVARVREVAADATVGLGGRLLHRLLMRAESAPAVEAAVLELAEDPADEDRLAALRLQIRKVLAADAELAADVAGMLLRAGGPVVASGTRSVAMRDNAGIVQTGDASASWQRPDRT